MTGNWNTVSPPLSKGNKLNLPAVSMSMQSANMQKQRFSILRGYGIGIMYWRFFFDGNNFCVNKPRLDISPCGHIIKYSASKQISTYFIECIIHSHSQSIRNAECLYVLVVHRSVKHLQNVDTHTHPQRQIPQESVFFPREQGFGFILSLFCWVCGPESVPLVPVCLNIYFLL